MRTLTGAESAKPVTTSRGWEHHRCWAVGMAFVVPLAFALFTNHVWEDYYITFRASQNLADGQGLVYQVGERVHSFTSPLGVLLPAFFYFLTQSDIATLWIFRLVSCGVLAFAVALLWRLLEREGARVITPWIVTILLLTESKLVDFAINGMESSLSILFAVGLLVALIGKPSNRSLRIGLAMAGLMWTRPDGFIVSGAILFGWFLFGRDATVRLTESLWALTRSLLWAAVGYGPWVVWASWYYGSPVPHTIIAKSGGLASDPGIVQLLLSPVQYLSPSSAMGYLFSPSYYFFGDWPAGLIGIQKAVGVVAGFVWLIPKLPRAGRLASFAVLMGSFYLQSIPAAPWYFPVWTMLCAVSLATACGTWMGARTRGHFDTWSNWAARIAVALFLLSQSWTLGLAAQQSRAQQVITEDHGRVDIGGWLKANAQPNDTVFLEPLGYIGYYSQLRMLDFPGLSAPAVVEARSQVGDNFVRLIDRLQPTWVILRPADWTERGFETSSFLKVYQPTRIWDATKELADANYIPGHGLLEHDSVFILFRRRHENRSSE